nr:uncharacterized protein LOC109433402 [Aedes albopictus]XP_029718355.1 uncharacterized protein LOC109403301 [Aedes albopictus]
MRFGAERCIYCLGALLAINQIGLLSAAELTEQKYDAVTTRQDQIPDDGGGSSKVLSRKRRFLQFPEGSSFQVVYDQTIPVVGSTLLFTVGVTVALAYQLPSISIFEISKMLREHVADGVHLRRKDENFNDTTLVDTSTNKYEQSNKHSYYYNNPYGSSQQQQTNGTKNILSYYNNLQQQNQPPQMGYNNRIQYYTSSNDSRYGAYQSSANNWQSTHPSFSLKDLPPNFLSPYNHTRNDWNSVLSKYFLNWVRKHPPNYHLSKKRFYPVFGKRSIEEHTHPEDKFFLNHHRSTRHDLYLQIEKFLDAKGKHGHHCVLRALCESGQRRNANEPDSFLKEILKAVFSMPTTHEKPVHHKHRMYDEAHGHDGDCAEKFSYCQDSIWSDSFIF